MRDELRGEEVFVEDDVTIARPRLRHQLSPLATTHVPKVEVALKQKSKLDWLKQTIFKKRKFLGEN